MNERNKMDTTTLLNDLTAYVRAHHGVDIGSYCRAYLLHARKTARPKPPPSPPPAPPPSKKDKP